MGLEKDNIFENWLSTKLLIISSPNSPFVSCVIYLSPHYFVKKYLSEAAISPLDGNEEAAGDAILFSKGKLILIEFKRNKECLDSEKSKFNDLNKATENMSSKDSHHFFIYGSNQNSNFKLKSVTYFSRTEKEITAIFQEGKKYIQFNEYLKLFLKYKSEGGSGGGIKEVKDFSLVAMVDNNGDAISCIAMAEYLELHPEINQVLNQDNDFTEDDSPSLGRM